MGDGITGNERVNVLMEIEKHLELLRRTEFAKLIPEVGSNMAFAIKDAGGFNDVAAVPGRIRNAMGRPVFLKPMFGASSHIASLLLAAMRHDGAKRCAINIRYSEDIINACRSLGLRTVFIDRMEEPDAVRDEEGASVPWVLDNAIAECGCVPDAIYHKGAVGKEAMTILIGDRPAHLTEIVIELLKKL